MSAFYRKCIPRTPFALHKTHIYLIHQLLRMFDICANLPKILQSGTQQHFTRRQLFSSQPKNLLVVSPWVVSLSFEYSRNYKLSIRINPPRKSNSFYRLTYLLMNLTCLLVAEGWFFQFLICPPSLLEMVTRPYNSNLLD
jgi:hypothetical protein